MAAKLLNCGSQITKNYHHLLTICEAEARQTRGDRATLPSFASRNGSIDVSRSSPEAHMERYFMQLEGEVGHSVHGKKLPACDFSFVCGAEGDTAASASFESRNGSIDASKLSLEAQMERDFMLLEGEVGHCAH